MTEEFSLSIVKIEGLGDLSSSECILLLDNEQVCRNPLQSFPIALKIPGGCLISLNISDSASNTKIAGLSFNSLLLPCDWFYWLPLFLSSENFIDQLPTSISLPRILLAVNKQFFPELLNTLDETSPKKDLKNSLKNPSNVLQGDLTEHYQKMIRDLQLELQQLRETSRQKCEFLQKKIENFHENLKIEKKFRLDLETKLEKILDFIENYGIFAKSPKNLQNFFSFDPSRSPKSRKSEKNFLVTQILKYQEKQSEYCKRASTRGERLKIETCEPIQVTSEFLTMEDRPLTTLFEETCKPDSDIDTRVKSILSRLKFEGLLHKRREVNYKIGAKTITATLKNNEILVKSGLTLEKYLFSHCRSEIEDYLRSKASPKKPPNRSPLSSSRNLRHTQRFE